MSQRDSLRVMEQGYSGRRTTVLQVINDPPIGGIVGVKSTNHSVVVHQECLNPEVRGQLR